MSNELQSLEAQIAELVAKKNALLDAQRSQVLKETKKTIALYGFSANELGLTGDNSAPEEVKTKTRRTTEQRLADEQAKHEKAVSEAKAAFSKSIQVKKFTNEKTGEFKYYWNGKKGIMPNGEGVVVKSVEEII